MISDEIKKLRRSKQRRQLAIMEYMLEKEADIDALWQEVMWITEDARSFHVYDMDTKHLLNAREMLLKREFLLDMNIIWKTYINIFSYELGKRYIKTRDPKILPGLI